MKQFEELCELASQENWIWKLRYATCSHMHFRCAYVEMTNRKSPVDTDFQIHTPKSNLRSLRAFPSRLNVEQIQAVLKVCLGTDIVAIVKNCRFRDLLSFVGFVLNHTSGLDYQQSIN